MKLFTYSENEKPIYISKISKAAIIGIWVSIPAFLFVVFCITYLPGIISTYASSAIKEKIMETLGVEELDFCDILSYVSDSIYSVFGKAANVVKGIIKFFTTVLIIVWVIWGICITKRGINNALVITDQNRIYAYSNGQYLTAELKDISRTYIDRSIWGKIFRYGALTIYAEGQSSITVKNISNPKQFERKLIDF